MKSGNTIVSLFIVLILAGCGQVFSTSTKTATPTMLVPTLTPTVESKIDLGSVAISPGNAGEVVLLHTMDQDQGRV